MIELLFDDEFGLCSSEMSERRQRCLLLERRSLFEYKESVEDFGSKLVSSSSGFSLDESEVKEQLDILSRGTFGYIKQFGGINIRILVFGGNWEGKLSSFMKPNGYFFWLFCIHV